MLYRPPNSRLGLWDTWLFQQGDAVHLFYLQCERTENGCSAIGHAVTRDWLHWETLPPVLRQGRGDAWDAGPLMTGVTLEHDGHYYLFYGAMVDRVQRIGLAVSDDLVHWEKVGDAPLLEAAGPWYQIEPSQALNYETAWRDPYIVYHAPEARFYAFICARAADAGDVGGGCVAVAQSDDLLAWSLLPPAYVSDALTCLEVPEYFRIGDRHYLTYTTSYHFGTPYPVQDPLQATGTFYLVSDAMLSGYHAPSAPNVLSASAPNAVTNYVGRSIPLEGKARRLYYYHHVYPPKPGERLHGSLAAPKVLEEAQAGALVVRYAPQVLERHARPVAHLAEPLSEAQTFALPLQKAADGIYQVQTQAPYAGLVLRVNEGVGGELSGLAVWLAPSDEDSSTWHIMLGRVVFADGPQGRRPFFDAPIAFRQLDDALHPHTPPQVTLRVVLRDVFLDVYVDDVLYLSHTYAPDALAVRGDVGVFYAGRPKQTALRDFRALSLDAL